MVYDYKNTIKVVNELANKDLKIALVKAGTKAYQLDKASYFDSKRELHIDNLTKLQEQYPAIENITKKYKEALLVANELANKDLKIALVKAGTKAYQLDKVSLFERKRDGHFVMLYKQIVKKKAIPLKKKSSDCFISNNRLCDVGGIDKKLVFIAGSGDKEFEVEVNIIEKVLKEKGYAPYFALFKQKFNEDAFCSKICSKILAASFCVVMLNNPIHNEAKEQELDIRTPSANVYFEYGLMTAINKKVIPLIRRNQKLPFNVQHLDALPYEDGNELYNQLKKNL